VHVTIDDKRCIAAGQCVLNAPQVFDQREEDGIVELLDDDPPPEQYAATRLAARLCPAEVITLGEE
jgi:ferredoxin